MAKEAEVNSNSSDRLEIKNKYDFMIDRAGIKDLLPAWRVKEKCNQKTGMLRQDFLTFSADYSANDAYVARIGDKVIGFIIFRPNGYISIFGVDPDYTRMGVGTALIEKLKKQLSELWCHVRITNKAAVRFYRDVGFHKTKLVEGYYSNGDNALVMECDCKEK
ncbi:GNAT family N-acetyltransferase [Methanonatronarchaeum sp. AMET6-2]|uniref:GNAT family N-acetyltransferase n=1 Tax=Methanonatronarchaeum sp. AMET6-2 TaxID=2933293 RepID=UPI00120B4A38|nr:GNAT family N-acetyltransferase [Methanonatronarchaeum sp. AMET6-2]RZN63343.1 MAG: GNAT family N-acetyltransferase [Methanonatronarchaeia archaeon]UOY10597.1 GNAT family N-acetyltransferase [Methanonatronarchaeum sp. AMET6-2]